MDIDALLKLVGSNRDSAMLRLTLARLLMGEGDKEKAESHLRQAVEMDSRYTAAWKELGKIRVALDDVEGARTAWQRGLEIAEKEGDKQAAKEMTVFLRRLDKSR